MDSLQATLAGSSDLPGHTTLPRSLPFTKLTAHNLYDTALQQLDAALTELRQAQDKVSALEASAAEERNQLSSGRAESDSVRAEEAQGLRALQDENDLLKSR